MKLFHISDLHIGKHLNTYNLKELQQDILHQIVCIVKEQQPDVVLVAGDIYDKSIPSSEAFDVFDSFLNEYALENPNIPILIIAGNHDDASRLNFGSAFFSSHNIHISTLPPQSEEEYLKKITLQDEYGDVNFYLLPFTRPSMIRKWNPDLTNYNDALSVLIDREHIDTSVRNVLLSHQFFVNGDYSPMRSESELNYKSVGGLDSIETSIVDAFDYVALGHIHGNQPVGKDCIRYSGTPIKYSLSEINQTKGIQVVELNEKGNILYSFIELESNPKIRYIKGTLQEVLDASNASNCDDYVYIALTDDTSINPMDSLREKYSHIVEVKNLARDMESQFMEEEEEDSQIDPFESFKDFYFQMKQVVMSASEEELVKEIIEEASIRGEV